MFLTYSSLFLSLVCCRILPLHAFVRFFQVKHEHNSPAEKNCPARPRPLLAIGWLLWPSKTPEPVLTAQVTRQDVEQTVLASGVLQAIEQVDVGAQVSGQVTYLAVEAGQKVKQGICWPR